MTKIRLKFSKNGPIRFIGHLDVMRYFQKVNRRSCIDVKYSEGYSPHQILSFALPLGVGSTSDGEYLDMTVNSMQDIHELMSDMNKVMNEGIKIMNGRVLPEDSPKAMTEVAAASYLVSFYEGKEPFNGNWKQKFNEFAGSEHIFASKKTKAGIRELDLKPLIYKYEIRGNEIYMLLSAGSVDHVKPSLVISAFLGIPADELPPCTIRIHRVDTYLQKADDNGTYIEPLICDDEASKIYIHTKNSAD